MLAVELHGESYPTLISVDTKDIMEKIGPWRIDAPALVYKILDNWFEHTGSDGGDPSGNIWISVDGYGSGEPLYLPGWGKFARYIMLYEVFDQEIEAFVMRHKIVSGDFIAKGR